MRLTSRRLHARFCKCCMYMRPCSSLRDCVRGRKRICRWMCISLSHDRCWIVRHYSCSCPSSSAGSVRIAAASRVAHASAVAVVFVLGIRRTRCQKLCGAHLYRRKLLPSVLSVRVIPYRHSYNPLQCVPAKPAAPVRCFPGNGRVTAAAPALFGFELSPNRSRTFEFCFYA